METMEPMEVSENPTENSMASGASWLEAPRGFFLETMTWVQTITLPETIELPLKIGHPKSPQKGNK